MPKPTTKKPQSFRGYANYEPSPKIKALIKSLPNEPHDTYKYIDDLVESGFRVTLNLDDFNQTWQCTVSHTDKTHRDAGVFLVCRGSTWQKAVRQAHYAVEDFTENDTAWETLLTKPKVELDD